MKQFKELTSAERKILSDAWEWLSENDYPFDVTENSRYLFTMDQWTNNPIAVAELRDYGHTLWVQILFVDEEYRNLGIGQTLLQRCIDASSKEGMKCGLATHQDNNAMQRLATKLGFSSPTIHFTI